MMDSRDLLRRSERGVFTQEELAQVANELMRNSDITDRATLLRIIGHSGDRAYRSLIETYLEHQDDPHLVRLALEILCLYWNESEKYTDYIRRFVRGQSWDSSNNVRQMAVSAAGAYLRRHDDPSLLGEIVGIVEHRDGEWPGTWEAAYWALVTVVGLDRNQILLDSQELGKAPPSIKTVASMARARMGRTD